MGQTWSWVGVHSFVFRHGIWATPLATVKWYLRPSMDTPSEMLERITLHDLLTLLDVSEATATRTLPVANRPCLCSRVSASIRKESGVYFEKERSKLLIWSTRLDNILLKMCSISWYLLTGSLSTAEHWLFNPRGGPTLEHSVVLVAQKLSLTTLFYWCTPRNILLSLRNLKFGEKI